MESKLESLKSATIMLIDDEPTTIEMLSMFLESEGYENVVGTTDSRLALDLIASKRPDVVLLDLDMPHVDGFSILASVREDAAFRHTPVIILTAASDATAKLRALELGASDFLSKPVDASELALRLRNTLAAKAYQDRLTYYDGLTGLPNKRLLTERLGRTLHRAGQESIPCAVLHVQLDRFKQLNDALGPQVGDQLLLAIAQRLGFCTRSGDLLDAPEADSRGMVARVGVDEFALFIWSAAGEDAARTGRRIVENLSRPLCVDAQDLFVTCGIGIALFPGDGSEIETLLRHARMSHAKARGQGGLHFYSEALNADSLERLKLENQLRLALDRDEIFLLYQPKLDLRSGRIIGAEALMRWQNPELGLVMPARFIPIAEETGLIDPLCDWGLRTACRQAAEWNEAGFEPITMAVNVSGRQFASGRLLGDIEDALRASGLAARQLIVELTEGTIMARPEVASETLRQMKDMGLWLSVDDFGTGYSAFSHLRRFPLDELKIDRSFVQGIPEDGDGAAIVMAIIAMAHNLGMRVVAEGVETQDQLAFLRDLACNEYQGFLFSVPVAPDAFARLLEKDGARG